MNTINSKFSGSFYTNNKKELTTEISNYLEKITKTIKNPKALIVPHAGYIYSGQTAAYSYKQCFDENIKNIIILGPSHQVYTNSLTIPEESSYTTPLGEIFFNTKKINTLIASNNFQINSKTHYKEHSLEVQLPFIQHTLPNAKIIPISVGNINMQMMKQAAETISKIIDNETLLIISTDLSHFHSLAYAKEIDNKTIELILKMNNQNIIDAYQKNEIELCGIFPVCFAIEILQNFSNIKSQFLHYDTSATASTDTYRVVGYSSIAFY